MFRLSENQEKDLKELMRAIATLKNEDECMAFFCDLCTVQELLQLTSRMQVAKGLMLGQTYSTIHGYVSVSNATITRINTVLQYGMGGYRTVFDRLTSGACAEANNDD